MSFYASNSRIKVLDGTDTVFDTSENMPHIVGTATVTADVSYGNISSTSVYWYSYSITTFNPDSCTANPDYCTYSPTPPYCTPGICYSNPDYCYTPYCPPPYCPPPWCPPAYCGPYDYFCFPPYCPPAYCPPAYCPTYCTPNPPWCMSDYCTYNPPTAYCVYTPPYCVATPPYTEWYDVNTPQYAAKEVSTDTDLVSLPLDENNNPIDIDFVVIQASGSRTLDGQDVRLKHAFQTTVPSGTFSFQGSALLESSARDDGSFWLRRIISVFVNHDTKKLVLRKQESVATRMTEGEATGTEASTFHFSFKVFFGRFKS